MIYNIYRDLFVKSNPTSNGILKYNSIKERINDINDEEIKLSDCYNICCEVLDNKKELLKQVVIEMYIISLNIYYRRNYNKVITKQESIAMKLNPKTCEKLKEASKIINNENIPLESLKDLLKIYDLHIRNIFVKFNTKIVKLKYDIIHFI